MLLSIKYLTFDITFGSRYYNKSFFNEKTSKKGSCGRRMEQQQKRNVTTCKENFFGIPSFVFSVCLTDLFPSRNWNVHVRCPNVFVTVHLPLDNMSKTERVVTTTSHYCSGLGKRTNDDLRWKIYFSGVGQMLEFAQSIKTCFLLRFSSRCQVSVPFFKESWKKVLGLHYTHYGAGHCKKRPYSLVYFFSLTSKK